MSLKWINKRQRRVLVVYFYLTIPITNDKCGLLAYFVKIWLTPLVIRYKYTFDALKCVKRRCRCLQKTKNRKLRKSSYKRDSELEVLKEHIRTQFFSNLITNKKSRRNSIRSTLIRLVLQQVIKSSEVKLMPLTFYKIPKKVQVMTLTWLFSFLKCYFSLFWFKKGPQLP